LTVRGRRAFRTTQLDLTRVKRGASRESLDPEQRDCAQANLRSELFLANVTRDIQDFARLESGRLDLELEEFRPAKVVEDTLDAFKIVAAHKGLELESLVAARLPARARGDAGRLRQILANLILRMMTIPFKSTNSNRDYSLRDSGAPLLIDPGSIRRGGA
jgi:signal transduction histidine kinase